MRRMGIVNGVLAPMEPDKWTVWNTPDAELLAKIGPGEVTRAVPWSGLTREQKDFQRTKMAIHAAMITRMDAEIGKVLRQVDAMGAGEDTVVLFVSDNGASSEQLIRGDGHDASAPPGSARSYLGLGPGWSSNSNAPFRLHKSWLHEGGIASPLIVRWTNGVKDRNALRRTPAHFVDIVPTLVDLAGGGPTRPDGGPPLSGRSLAPAFGRDREIAREFLYFNHNNNRALRVGNWKLLSTGEKGPWELFDLSKDRCEQRNLAALQGGRVDRMARLWEEQDAGYARVREAAAPTTKTRMAGG
jgi:arylsulfatase A-like enzyme